MRVNSKSDLRRTHWLLTAMAMYCRSRGLIGRRGGWRHWNGHCPKPYSSFGLDKMMVDHPLGVIDSGGRKGRLRVGCIFAVERVSVLRGWPAWFLVDIDTLASLERDS